MWSIKKIIKYVYLTTVIILFIFIIIFNQINKDFNNTLNEYQKAIIQYYTIDINKIYIVLTLLAIVILDGFGIKDIFGLFNFFIIMISKILHDDKIVQIFISLLISGFLCNFHKFIRYYYFSIELQFILSKPLDFGIFIIKKIPLINRLDLSFLTTKYIILVSEYTKDDTKYSILYNFRNNFTNIPYLNNFISFIISILWLTMTEWVHPFKELVLFVHNWKLTFTNISLITISEFLDIDKILEIVLLIKNNNLMDVRLIIIILNACISIISYLFVLIPTLMWTKKYYYSEFYKKTQSNENQIENINVQIELS